jgi:uncharacterized damage-inducible protein DinB
MDGRMTGGPDYFAQLAAYNRWANRRLFAACAELSTDEYHAPRRAFFGSIHRTLNHILVGDRLWFSRVEGQALNYPLDHELYADLPSLRAARQTEDDRILQFVQALPAERLAGDLSYRNVAGEAHTTPLRFVLGHIFNHQTHHRGQVHDMLSQTAVAPPPIDLIYFVRARPAQE